MQTRVSVRGKFLFAGADKFYIKGVTYGTFRPDAQGTQYPAPEVVQHDFVKMATVGINAVRVYTPPPIWLLDLAGQNHLYVIAGLPWEQHMDFLSESHRPSAIEHRVRAEVRDSANHPALLAYVVGNEIPSSIVRWHSRSRIERFIRSLYRAVKEEAPDTLATYVNYPTTEYLDLSFLDFLCFNVYLESKDKLDAYLAQLQNVAGDRPLIMAEVGLDSRRNGKQLQAEVLDWQIRSSFAAGCAGVFLFAWTDEWYRGGYDIEEWDFGLTTRDRRAKPALTAASLAFAEVPFPHETRWPKVSVVVCTHNGARTIRSCLEGLRELDYPSYEVIIVNDGSADETAEIAGLFPFRLITTENRGLSCARNTGMDAASGEIVAYIDDDARPDPQWLQYLAWTYLNSDYAAVGGPNIPPPEDGPVAECVANAPGGPVHVLLTHRDAEHIPGCNFSFRKDRLMSINGFDPRFRKAGDDVDICWRFLDRGWKIGFNPGAMVWHHRRSSFQAYFKQQANYGNAEALLRAKWPSKYNSFGGVTWTGRLYGKGLTRPLARSRIYHGYWNSAPFQRLYSASAHRLASLTLTPQWYLLNLTLASMFVLSAPGALLRLSAVPLLISALIPLVCVARSISGAVFLHNKLRYRLLTGVLHLVQPVARFWGSFEYWLKRERRRGFLWTGVLGLTRRVWSEEWKPAEEWLRALEKQLLSQNAAVFRGDDFQYWDIEARRGMAAGARMTMAIEEHGAGKQLLLFRLQPRVDGYALVVLILFTLFSATAFFDHGIWLGSIFGVVVFVGLVNVIMDTTAAAHTVDTAIESLSHEAQCFVLSKDRWRSTTGLTTATRERKEFG
jgi:glycosyltransferase involved in cell wall biosynthesis